MIPLGETSFAALLIKPRKNNGISIGLAFRRPRQGS